MIIVLHVVFAFAGLAASGLAYFSPSRPKLRNSYALIFLTIASGTYLVVSRHAALAGACISGLLYLSVTLTATVLASKKLPA